MNSRHDFIVVGSGPSAAMAAQTLVEGGAKICMLDAGITDKTYTQLIPKKDFLSIRRNDPEQSTYILGKELEGLSFGKVDSAAQLTPPRKYVTEGVDTWGPSVSPEFKKVESLAYGGLGAAWGLGAFTYTDREIRRIGLEPNDLKDAYRIVAERIGVSGAFDDGALIGSSQLTSMQQPVNLETHFQKLLASYQKKKGELNNNGFYLGHTPLALLTETLNGRQPTDYSDMDFWTNHGESAYRPQLTIDQLKTQPNFTYYGGMLVLTFRQTQDHVEVDAINIETSERRRFTCNRLILCAGAFGTARIVLRSLGKTGTRLPIISDTYRYFPSIQPDMFGVPADDRKISYSQLTLYCDFAKDGSDISTVQLYKYSSLMLFRLAPELPFNLADTLKLLRLGVPNLLIAGLHQPDTPSKEKFLELLPDGNSPTGDKLSISYKLSHEEIVEQKHRERKITRALRAIGCYPIKRIDPGVGSSLHYGGTLPFDPTGKEYSITKDGKLAGYERVYIADGSGFKYMPAKGPTLTFMAFAHRVAKNLLK